MYIRTYEHEGRCGYLFGTEGFHGPLAVVDPVGDIAPILAERRDRPIEMLFLTSGRFDGEAVRALRAATGAPVHAHRALGPALEAAAIPLAARLGGGDRLDLGGVGVRVLATPGVDRGGMVVLVADSYLFTGETLPIGALDPTAPASEDPTSHYVSLRMLRQLPGGTEVLPGRRTITERRSTLAREAMRNPLLTAPSLQAFLALR
jgi:glyoxylase-like metal-dependent hydrolase (beta-lactamase superfamily II)